MLKISRASYALKKRDRGLGAIEKLSFAFLVVVLLGTSFTNVYAGEAEDLKQRIEEKQRVIEELKKQAEEYSETLNQKKEEADTLETRIIAFNREIKGLETQAKINETNIAALELKITKTELQIKAHEAAISRNKEEIAALIREIYTEDNKEFLELVLQYESFSDFSNYVQYRNTLQGDLDERLEELKTFKDTLEGDKETLGSEKAGLVEDKQALVAKKRILDSQRSARKKLLLDTRNEEDKYQKLLSDTERKEAEELREIFELEDSLRRVYNPELIPQKIPGVLSWPVEGIISQPFGCIETRFARRSYPACNNGLGGFHNGLDVAAPLGTVVRSARDGQVIAIENSPYAYGNWVAVLHDNGLVTAYPHMSDIIPVGVGDTVKRGDVVGYMDTTGFSTGSHLHFMVYAPNTFTTKPSKLAGILPVGVTLNPFDYLP